MVRLRVGGREPIILLAFLHGLERHDRHHVGLHRDFLRLPAPLLGLQVPPSNSAEGANINFTAELVAVRRRCDLCDLLCRPRHNVLLLLHR